jgi:hypothetical protein
MAKRKRLSDALELETELNLAPIMNIVMILIPLLLVTATFVSVNTLAVNSPQNAQSIQPPEQEDEEETPVPRLLVAISEDGFRISDMRQSPAFAESGLADPIDGCGGDSLEAGSLPITICNNPEQAADEALLDRLDWRGFYNQLVRIKNYDGGADHARGWRARWDDQNCILNVVADREIPFEVVIRTMDIARYLLQQDHFESEEEFRASVYIEEGEGRFKDLFPIPVLLLPRAASD